MHSFAEWLRLRREGKDREHQQRCWYGLDEDSDDPTPSFWFALTAALIGSFVIACLL